MQQRANSYNNIPGPDSKTVFATGNPFLEKGEVSFTIDNVSGFGIPK